MYLNFPINPEEEKRETSKFLILKYELVWLVTYYPLALISLISSMQVWKDEGKFLLCLIEVAYNSLTKK